MFRRMKFLVLLVLTLAQSEAEGQEYRVCKGADVKLFTAVRLPATLYRNNIAICIWRSNGSRTEECEERVSKDDLHNIRLYNVSPDDTGVYTLMFWGETVGKVNLSVSGECNVAVIAMEENGIYGIYRIIFGVVVAVCALSVVANTVFIPLYCRLRKKQYNKVKYLDDTVL